jgi:hypothetical protein
MVLTSIFEHSAFLLLNIAFPIYEYLCNAFFLWGLYCQGARSIEELDFLILY